MSFIPGVEEIDGELKATAQNIEPPRDWTNNFEMLGGMSFWAPGGFMHDVAMSRGIDGEAIRPLYATIPMTELNAVLFEADRPAGFYIFDRQTESLRQVIGMDKLEDLVEWLNDENNQFSDLPAMPM